MPKSTIHSYDQLPLTLNQKDISAFLGISRSSTYKLFKREDFPIIRIGKRFLVPRDKFLQWAKEQLQF